MGLSSGYRPGHNLSGLQPGARPVCAAMLRRNSLLLVYLPLPAPNFLQGWESGDCLLGVGEQEREVGLVSYGGQNTGACFFSKANSR